MNGNDAVNFFQRAMKPLKDRVLLMIGRAVIAAVDDAKPIQQLQIKVLNGESLGKVQRYQNYGHNAVPPAGCEGIILFLGGNRENGAVLGLEHRDLRPQGWLEGESGLYNSDGMIAVLRTGGKFEVANDAEDLVTVLSDLVQAIIESKNITAIGPQPMTPESVLAITEIKERLDTFKV